MSEPVKDVNSLKISIAPNLFHGVRYKKDGKNKLRATVKTHTAPWPAIVKKLSKLVVKGKKEDCPYMVFASFKNKDDNGEYTRQNNNIDMFYGAVLDIDDPDSPVDHEDVVETLESLGLNYAVYTTHSYDPWTEGKENKFRVVVPYDTPVAGTEQPYCVVGLAEMLGVAANFDNCSKTASQPMYWHSCPSARCDDALFYSGTKGKFLDPDEAHEIGKMQDGTDHATKSALPKMTPGVQIDAGDRHEYFRRYMAKRKNEGANQEDLRMEIIAINAKLDEPLDDEQVEGLIDRVWTTFERNRNGFGFNHHMGLIKSQPMQQKEVYDAVIQGMADSRDQLDAAEIKELIDQIKTTRPGSTLKSIEAHYKEVVREVTSESDETIREQVERLKKRAERSCKHIVWLEQEDRFVDLRNNAVMTSEALTKVLVPMFNELKLEFYDAFDALKLVPLKFMLAESLFQSAASQRYYPGRDQFFVEDGVCYLNTYKGPEWEGMGGDVGPMLAHFDFLIDCETSREAVLNFIAYLVQQPGKKMAWMPIIHGGYGVGKSFLTKWFLRPILGRDNVAEVPSNQVKSEHNSWAMNSQLVVFQEVKFGRNLAESMEATNNIKTLITEDRIGVRKMRTDLYQADNVINLFGFTNLDDGVYLEPGERRFLIIEGPKIPLDDPAHPDYNPNYYTELASWCADVNNQDAIFSYFEDRDISDFNPDRRVENDFTRRVKEDMMPWPMNVLSSLMANPDCPLTKVPVMTRRNITLMVKAATAPGKDGMRAAALGSGGRSREETLLTRALESMRFRTGETGTVGNRIKVGGRKEGVWLSPDFVIERRGTRFEDYGLFMDELETGDQSTQKFLKMLADEAKSMQLDDGFEDMDDLFEDEDDLELEL